MSEKTDTRRAKKRHQVAAKKMLDKHFGCCYNIGVNSLDGCLWIWETMQGQPVFIRLFLRYIGDYPQNVDKIVDKSAIFCIDNAAGLWYNNLATMGRLPRVSPFVALGYLLFFRFFGKQMFEKQRRTNVLFFWVDIFWTVYWGVDFAYRRGKWRCYAGVTDGINTRK